MSSGALSSGPMGLTKEYVEWLESDESVASNLLRAPSGSIVLRMTTHRDQGRTSDFELFWAL